MSMLNRTHIRYRSRGLLEAASPGLIIEVLTEYCGRFSLLTGGWSVGPDLPVVAALAYPWRTVLVAPGWTFVANAAPPLATHHAPPEGGLAAVAAGPSASGATRLNARSRRRRRCSVLRWRFS